MFIMGWVPLRPALSGYLTRGLQHEIELTYVIAGHQFSYLSNLIKVAI